MNSAIRRRLIRVAPAATVLLALTACSSGSPHATPTSAASSPGRHEAAPSAASSPSDRSSAMNIRVTLDGHRVDATLNDSPAARDFARLLPLTLDLEDFHSTERIADLPRKLDTSGAPAPAAAKVGDIAHYAPWGNLALFYRNGPAPSADLLILGHLDVSADQLGGADRITIEADS
ncbi:MULTISPECIES: cyclophilin-like fold protein [Streptomyces]|uniref:cyclophilin-like fold protein n=1 Tax=Streptomyces TaxID=1883 RepID=UPI002E7FD208|nr:cyclophilin-like fold protein [Streptomyces sp. NBC_00582]WUB60948.1 cyclophilin-like fold protein [Streptomyces sp. NBC_00582]